MSKLVFDKASERFYETGVSHGVLFVKGDDGAYEDGVAWNGLTAVTESPEGAEETALYADNIKYLALRSVEEFKGTIECYTYPDAFERCDGSANLVEGVPGVKLTQQKRASFGFCYLSKKGNAENEDLGSILHIIYGASVSPAEKAYETVNDSPDAITFSYEFSTVKVEVEGFKPTSHIEVDSTKLDEFHWGLLIDYIYGVDADTEKGIEAKVPTLPMPEKVIELITTTPPTKAKLASKGTSTSESK